MQWHFGSGTLVPPVGFDSNNNQILAFGGTKAQCHFLKPQTLIK